MPGLRAKPKLFVASSSHGLPIAYALQNRLEMQAEVTVWDQNVFAPSEFILEGLIQQLDSNDFGAFVFTPDDVLQIKGDEHPVARDNVLFELGLFIGRKGRKRSMIVRPRDAGLYLPSDLLGLNFAEFDGSRKDGNLEAAVGPVCSKLTQMFEKCGAGPVFPREMQLGMNRRAGILSNTQRQILKSFDTAKDYTAGELQAKNPDTPWPELHYRIEQLRLLRFIDVQVTTEGNVYCVSALYAAASTEVPKQMGTSIG